MEHALERYIRVKEENVYNEGVRDGEEKGIEKGIEIGKEKGIEIGITQGEENTKLEIAKSLLDRGFTITDIIDITKLDEAQIKQLIKKEKG